jgi:predicted alpha/beta-fold hydrolase
MKIIMAIIAYIKLGYLTTFQNGLIFKPWPKNVEAIRTPEAYGLKDFEDKFITTSDNIKINIWHKPAAEGKPTFIVFHGNTGHFGDVGSQQPGEPYYDRRYRTVTLRNMADTGCGVIAVSMRGYGNSDKVQPTQEGFALDINTLFKYILEQNISANNIIIFGESLGASMALMLLDEMNKNDFEPKITATIAAFSSIKNKAIDDNPDMIKIKLEKYIRHNFDNEGFFKTTESKTFFDIFHPEDDQTTPKYHSEKLFRIAHERGLRVEYQELKGAGHITWESKEVISKILEKYNLLTKDFGKI